MVRNDFTTNEKIKRSDFIHYCSKAIKKHKKMLENDEGDRDENLKKVKDFENDYMIL